MLKEISSEQRALDIAGEIDARHSLLGHRVIEAFPALISWLTLSAPLWLTLINPALGFAFVGMSIAYFVGRGLFFGARALRNRPRVLKAMRKDWLASLEQAGRFQAVNWRDCRVTFLIRAFREGNLAMLSETVNSIYASNWTKDGMLLRNVQVVFATEQHDRITPPLVEQLAQEFRGRLIVRQIRHPFESDCLPGPSTAMHYAGRVLYREAQEQGLSPYHCLVADLDADTILHSEYLPCLVYHYVTDPHRQFRVYQPVVAFTIDYWRAPFHSRISAIGSTALTLSWHRSPEIAFTGAAASLALLRSVDFWPTNSHSQDSGIDLRLRLRYGRRFRIIGIPLPLRVYPVMALGAQTDLSGRMRAYFNSFRALFRQSARWREGPIDEFVEAVRKRNLRLVAHRLWNGLERDTLTILPGYGYFGASIALNAYNPSVIINVPGAGSTLINVTSTAVLTAVSLIGLIVFWQLLHPAGQLVTQVSRRRRLVELFAFWLVFGIYIPLLTGVAGLKTATLYLLGRRPRGHFAPTPK